MLLITVSALAQAITADVPAELPTIQFKAHVKARSLTIEKRGDVSLEVTGNGRKVVAVEAPDVNGRAVIPNPVIDFDAKVYLEDPQNSAEPAAPPGN